jgi:phage-related tail protein
VGTAAAGTDRARRGTYLVGENGPELVSMRGGERVLPTSQTMALMGSGGGGSVVIQLQLNDRTLQELVVRQDQLKRGTR